MGRVVAILAGILLVRVRWLVLHQEVLELRLLRQRVRFADPKFLLFDFRVLILIDSVMEHDNL